MGAWPGQSQCWVLVLGWYCVSAFVYLQFLFYPSFFIARILPNIFFPCHVLSLVVLALRVASAPHFLSLVHSTNLLSPVSRSFWRSSGAWYLVDTMSAISAFSWVSNCWNGLITAVIALQRHGLCVSSTDLARSGLLFPLAIW